MSDLQFIKKITSTADEDQIVPDQSFHYLLKGMSIQFKFKKNPTTSCPTREDWTVPSAFLGFNYNTYEIYNIPYLLLRKNKPQLPVQFLIHKLCH